jgi:hypothetical protein
MQPQQDNDFERETAFAYPCYRISGDFNVEIATLTPTQAKQLLLWLRTHEQQIEEDILLEQAWRKQQGERKKGS